MKHQSKQFLSTGDRRALPVVLLGTLIAIVPLILVPSPGDGGPITFGVRLLQAIAVLVGLGVGTTGVYSYRSGNLRPAVAAAMTIIGLLIVGVVGGLVETTGGPLIPIWVWILAAVVAISASLAVTHRFVSGEQR